MREIVERRKGLPGVDIRGADLDRIAMQPSQTVESRFGRQRDLRGEIEALEAALLYGQLYRQAKCSGEVSRVDVMMQWATTRGRRPSRRRTSVILRILGPRD